jgi:hypothetical protein
MIRRAAALILATVWWPGGPPSLPPLVEAPSRESGATVDVARWRPSSSPRRAGARNPLRVGTFLVPLRVMALPVLPEQTVSIRPDVARDGFHVVSRQGRLRQRGPANWEWTAPGSPGVYAVRVFTEPGDTVDLTFMVLRRATEIRDGALNGYPIGAYRARPSSMSARYEPPAGFIEARPEDHDILVSPNFRLGQFLCKEPGDPRYLLVSPRLLVKLEALLESVNERGYATPSLTVMSGFRTPAYNRAIGNTTAFSRHLWGDAADVYVDADGNGDMDDLNGDGRSDIRDARWLSTVLESLMEDPPWTVEPGGLAAYRRNPVHGPFVHIDTRGRRARW